MLERLPVGVYLPGASLIHTLRARTKLLLLAWLSIIFFATNHRTFHPAVYIVSFALLAVAFALAHISPGYVWRRMRLLVLLLLIGVPFTLIWTPGRTWHTFGPWTVSFDGVTATFNTVITYDGLWFVISLGSIFLLLYLGSILLTLTTTPVALAEGIVLLLRPFRRVGLPADDFGLMTLICLRFFPILLAEAGQLLEAQLSRGAEFTTGSLTKRIHTIGTLLVPLVQGALRRAEGLSAALEARGYGVAGEATLLHEGPFALADWVVLVGGVAVTAIAYFAL